MIPLGLGLVEDCMPEKRKSLGGVREITRLFAVQAMYAADILRKPISEVLTVEYAEHCVVLNEEISIEKLDRVFFKELIEAYQLHSQEIEQKITSHLSKKWSIDRLDKVIIAILRLGVTELLYLPDIPHNVTFNEYVEIGKSYFNKSEVSFINGLLNMVYEDVVKKDVLENL